MSDAAFIKEATEALLVEILDDDCGDLQSVRAIARTLRAAGQAIPEPDRKLQIELEHRRSVMSRYPFCPDHRDKVQGLSCRQCEIERLESALRRASLPVEVGVTVEATDVIREGFAAALGLALDSLRSQDEGEEGFEESKRWAAWLVPILNTWADDVPMAPKIDAAIAALSTPSPLPAPTGEVDAWIHSLFGFLESTCPQGMAEEAFRVAPESVREAIASRQSSAGYAPGKHAGHPAEAARSGSVVARTAPSLNQPSPLVKAEALALSELEAYIMALVVVATDRRLDWDLCDSGDEPAQFKALRAWEKSMDNVRAALASHLAPNTTALDSAFEAEFDLLPEDAKPLCDTFFRSLRKRLGHPVEPCS